MKTLHVIVCIAGSSQAVSNLASTGLHLLFFLLVSLVNRRPGRCCLTSAHMKMRTCTPSADQRTHVWTPRCSETFSKRSFWENRGNSNLLQQMKTKTDERSLNLPDELMKLFVRLTFTVMKSLWKPQYYHNRFTSAKKTPKKTRLDPSYTSPLINVVFVYSGVVQECNQ